MKKLVLLLLLFSWFISPAPNLKSRRTTLSSTQYTLKARTLFKAMVVQPTKSKKKKINKFFKSTSSLPLLFLQVYNSQTEQQATLNWITPTSYVATFGGSYTYVPNQGITGNASNAYINTGFSPNSNGAGVFTQNSGSHGVWVNTELVEVNIVAGLTGATTSTDIFPRYTGNICYMYANSASGSGIANTSSIGYFDVDRNNSANEQYYVRGALLGTQTAASSTIPTGNDHVLCRWNAVAGSRSLYSAHQVGARWYTGTMTAAQHAQLNNAFIALFQ